MTPIRIKVPKVDPSNLALINLLGAQINDIGEMLDGLNQRIQESQDRRSRLYQDLARARNERNRLIGWEECLD